MKLIILKFLYFVVVIENISLTIDEFVPWPDREDLGLESEYLFYGAQFCSEMLISPLFEIDYKPLPLKIIDKEGQMTRFLMCFGQKRFYPTPYFAYDAESTFWSLLRNTVPIS
jgi:hypothetical protein